MGASVLVLCYHRVLPDDGQPQGRPYFLRGTAVTQAAFEQHVRDLRERFDCLDEARVLEVFQGRIELERPGCWITFDDAYVDVARFAAPVLAEATVPATVFVSTGVLAGATLPADRWYAVLTAAKRRRGLFPQDEPWEFDLDDPKCLSRLIDGPEKRRFLRSTQHEQEELLSRLATVLDADSSVPVDSLYLGTDEIRDLVRRGWSVGSHSVSHPILVGLSEERQRRELVDSGAQLAEIVGQWPRTFAYPDGAWDEGTARQVQDAGYSGAVTLEPAVARPGGSVLAVPRILARNDVQFVRALGSLAGA
jgi:peptidoglycan/xylan/chitin deacetylase (PgdA/CDA1 family)